MGLNVYSKMVAVTMVDFLFLCAGNLVVYYFGEIYGEVLIYFFVRAIWTVLPAHSFCGRATVTRVVWPSMIQLLPSNVPSNMTVR